MSPHHPMPALALPATTWDGVLNDIDGFHVKAEHAFAALDGARAGPVAEGNVGGGTGMVCHSFKGGIGTASRVLAAEDGGYAVGVLVQCNYGRRRELQVAGVPVGEEIPEGLPCYSLPGIAPRWEYAACADAAAPPPPPPGDIFVAFSAANPGVGASRERARVELLANDGLNPLFAATIQATEEAILNALLAALRRYGRLR